MLLLNLNERDNNFKTAIDSPTPENQSCITPIYEILLSISEIPREEFSRFIEDKKRSINMNNAMNVEQSCYHYRRGETNLIDIHDATDEISSTFFAILF